jgi:hypothetical protein
MTIVIYESGWNLILDIVLAISVYALGYNLFRLVLVSAVELWKGRRK